MSPITRTTSASPPSISVVSGDGDDARAARLAEVTAARVRFGLDVCRLTFLTRAFFSTGFGRVERPVVPGVVRGAASVGIKAGGAGGGGLTTDWRCTGPGGGLGVTATGGGAGGGGCGALWTGSGFGPLGGGGGAGSGPGAPRAGTARTPVAHAAASHRELRRSNERVELVTWPSPRSLPRTS